MFLVTVHLLIAHNLHEEQTIDKSKRKLYNIRDYGL